jgi:hypothetical protein
MDATGRRAWAGYAFAAACLFSISAPSFAADSTEPSYEDTIAFIQASASYHFVERNHCEFIYRDNYRFSAKSLNPVSSVTNWSVVFRCAQDKPCIDPRSSSKLAKQLVIDVKDINIANKVSKAMSHLIGLCGGSRVKSDLF